LDFLYVKTRKITQPGRILRRKNCNGNERYRDFSKTPRPVLVASRAADISVMYEGNGVADSKFFGSVPVKPFEYLYQAGSVSFQGEDFPRDTIAERCVLNF